MARARPTNPNRAGTRRRVLVVAALAFFAALAWFWAPLNARALAGASHDARIGCSCRFVAGRSLPDCRKDVAAGIVPVMLSEDEAENSVTATVPLLASQTAVYRKGQGCVLEPWRD